MVQNLRDLGGIKNIYGKELKNNCLIRSANLSQAEEIELDGIDTIIDLRTTEEKEQAPDLVYEKKYYHMPIFDKQIAGISHEKGTDNMGIPDMKVLYQNMIVENQNAIGSVLKTIMAQDYSSGAILWHCTEGKDRCGLITALVLEMLDVDRGTIMNDYLKTNKINLPKATSIRERLRTVRGEAFAQSVYNAFIADKTYLEASWKAMGKFYFNKLGISNDKIMEFRSKVLI
ncbi:MAG: tyrosine-protein phosphatase [Lachnospiraceae bacterium]|nr:tyrosine-protein phosphatase [Lachnospiraceae bacterium]